MPRKKTTPKPEKTVYHKAKNGRYYKKYKDAAGRTRCSCTGGARRTRRSRAALRCSRRLRWLPRYVPDEASLASLTARDHQ